MKCSYFGAFAEWFDALAVVVGSDVGTVAEDRCEGRDRSKRVADSCTTTTVCVAVVRGTQASDEPTFDSGSTTAIAFVRTTGSLHHFEFLPALVSHKVPCSQNPNCHATGQS